MGWALSISSCVYPSPAPPLASGPRWSSSSACEAVAVFVVDGLGFFGLASGETLPAGVPAPDGVVELEDEPPEPSVLGHAVDRRDVGMVQRGEQAGLALEAREALGIGREARRQDLDRDVAPQRLVACAVDLTHPARPDQIADRVLTEPLSRGAWRVGWDGQEAVRRRLGEERYDLTAERVVAGARGRVLELGFESRFHPAGDGNMDGHGRCTLRTTRPAFQTFNDLLQPSHGQTFPPSRKSLPRPTVSPGLEPSIA